MFKKGDRVVVTYSEKIGNQKLTLPGDFGVIKDFGEYGRVFVNFDIARNLDRSSWWVDGDKLVTPEVYNSPLFNVMKEEE